MAARDLRVVPRPRRVETHDERVRFETPLAIDSSEETAAVASLLEELLERETNETVTRASAGERPDVRLRLESTPSDRFDDPEGYVLEAGVGDEARSAGVTITAKTGDGLRNGCQTLVTALSADGVTADGRGGDGARWSLPACEIHDWPETEWRGFMLDPARGHLPVEDVKRRIDQAARAKYNRLHLHVLDDEGYALESEAYPELNRDADGTERPAYSPADVEEIVAYANRRGIRVLPEVDVPAHATHVLETYPELRCTVEDGEPADRTICIGRPETYEFVETLYAEVLELFPFEYVHVGGDEWEMHGHSWDECVDCRRKMAEEGSETVREHFYAFVRHLHGFLADRDRRTIMWNDQIDISESPDLPRDILIQFWRVAAPGRGPVEGVSMERFLEEGFDVLNSYVHAAYVRGWISEEYMLGWAPRRRPTVPEERASQVRGGELLAWEPSSEERHAYFERALPSAIPVFADRLWNPEPHDRPAFSQAVTRHALGPFVPDGFDIYRDLGGLIVPTNWRRSGKEPWAHANASLGDRTPAAARAGYEETLETLTGLRDEGEAVYAETADAYADVLEWLIEVADREGRGVIDRP
ncbi:family 20 glycosylhydrolase [Natrononativus amylolyticus]|uniref:family 20 glycosylhydrolase n=1 Tax=Natrononativus amylolyticus TaxID=2963434 RepID=UPI0020CBC261|nr:family 20 glycosylhydrolase [Natrononativus amylolyticus]